MAVAAQLAIPAALLSYSGKMYINDDGNVIYDLVAGQTAEILVRFALPRSASTGKGSQLTACSIGYIINSGGVGALTSLTPAISRVSDDDGSTQSITALTITGTSPTPVLNQGTTENRPESSVDESFDNQTADAAISYLYTVTIVANVACQLTVVGAEVKYNTDSSASATAFDGGVITANATFDVLDSGATHEVDTSGGAVTITLPDIAAIGPTAVVKVVAGGNALNISPDASDSIEGLGINDASTVDKDFILAAPEPGDYIKLFSDGTSAWYVLEAAGTWTREA